MKKYIILLILVALLILVICDINMPKGMEKKSNFKKLQNKNLHNSLPNSFGTLEEELVKSMKINYKKVNTNNFSQVQPILPSLEGASSIFDN